MYTKCVPRYDSIVLPPFQMAKYKGRHYFSITSQKDFVDLGGCRNRPIGYYELNFRGYIPRNLSLAQISRRVFLSIFFSHFFFRVFFLLKSLSVSKSNLSTVTKYFSTESKWPHTHTHAHIHTHTHAQISY